MSHRDYPRCGALTARLVRTDADGNPLAEPEEVPIPLQHTAVDARVTAYIARVVVEQQFANPFDHTIEAIYHFPLPQNAAIDEFVMRIGERSIRGIIRDRDEAERIYREARARGHVASLLTQERPNIFTQAVANIEPGKQIDIEIHYVHTLAYKDGWYEYVFPMVVGPRFNPPGTADPIAAVPRRASRTTPSPAGDGRPGTQIEYLHPTERSGHDIAVNLEIDAGVVIEELECVNHVVDVERETPGRARITLSPHDRIPNQDFVMRYRVTGETVKSALFTHQDERGGFFTMILYPPAAMSSLPRAPVEMVFLIDRSGSMQGAPMGKVRRALTRALRGLDARDTFQIVTFANDATACFPTAVPVTEENVRTGLAYIEQLTGGGGTMMVNGFRRALDVPPDPERLRLVSFMTDGKISNEVEVMQVAYEQLGNGRIFSFGVGSSPNRYLLDGLARIGNGAVAYVGLDENAGRAVDRFYERIRFPALTDITFDWGSWQVSDVYPSRIPDLFLGRAVIVTGRFEPGDGLAPGSIGVMGYQGGEVRELRVACDLGARQTHPGIASVWARRRIKDLEDSAVRATSHDQIVECESTIKDFALEYGLVSRFTAFIAVDSQSQTGPAQPVATVVPVPVPEGVLYETTVTGGRCQH
jgi:Ca-activated chloride channel family protein